MNELELNQWPNLLIVGAAKAGTTSLHYALAKHPQVFMARKKEPGYFAWPDQELQFINNGKLITRPRFLVNHQPEYLALFEDGRRKKIRGESSTTYLFFHEKTVSNIRRIHPKPDSVCIVIILRNPVERAFSQYMHKLRDGAEPLSFEEAIEEEMDRKARNWHFDYQYVQRGFYFQQVKTFKENFSGVKIYLSDDLRNDSLAMSHSIEELLGIEQLPLDLSSELNVSGAPKIASFNRFIKNEGRVKQVIGRLIPKNLRRTIRLKVQSTVRKYNLDKKELNAETEMNLKQLYRDDILKLQELIKRDLTAWIN